MDLGFWSCFVLRGIYTHWGRGCFLINFLLNLEKSFPSTFKVQETNCSSFRFFFLLELSVSANQIVCAFLRSGRCLLSLLSIHYLLLTDISLTFLVAASL